MLDFLMSEEKWNSQSCLSLGKSINGIFHLTTFLFSPNLYLGDKCILLSDFIEMGYKVSKSLEMEKGNSRAGAAGV